MNDINYSLSGQEKAVSHMEWEGNSSLVRFDGFSGENGISQPQIDGMLNIWNQPSTSGFTDRKRKSDFSSPLPMKFSRNTCNGEEVREEYFSINEMEFYKMHAAASGFSIDKSTSQMTVPESHGIVGQVISDNMSAMPVADSINDSIVDISASTSRNFCTVSDQSNSRTLHTHPELDVEKGKIAYPVSTEKLAFLRKGKPHSCYICHSKWALEANLKRHLASHATDGLTDTKHF